MSDYYEVHPLRVPRIPLSLTGFLGVEHDTIALTIASFTGLPCMHLTHLVEHVVGASARRVVAEQGEEEFLRIEAECLARALRSAPPGVIALGHATLLRPLNLVAVTSQSVLVHVYLDFEPLRERLAARLAEDPGAFLPWLRADRFCPEELARLLAERRMSCDEATLEVDATGRTAQSVALDIIAKLDLWKPE